MKPPREERDFTACEWFAPEIRVESEPDGPVIAGRGAVFGVWYDIGPNVKERVDRAAFDRTLDGNPDIRGMFNHDPNFLLGRTLSGTMEVTTSDKAMEFRIQADLEDSQVASVVRKIKRGDVDGSSMAFFVHKDIWEEDRKKGTARRTITELELIETGPVVFPASRATTAQVRAEMQCDGFDFGAVLSALMKRRAGFALTQTDVGLIQSAREVLAQLVSDSGNRAHSERVTRSKDASFGARLDLLQREFDLQERRLGL